MWDVADNPINYCSNKLKKLPDVVQSINKRSSEIKKYPSNSSLSQNSRNLLNFRPPKTPPQDYEKKEYIALLVSLDTYFFRKFFLLTHYSTLFEYTCTKFHNFLPPRTGDDNYCKKALYTLSPMQIHISGYSVNESFLLFCL